MNTIRRYTGIVSNMTYYNMIKSAWMSLQKIWLTLSIVTRVYVLLKGNNWPRRMMQNHHINTINACLHNLLKISI